MEQEKFDIMASISDTGVLETGQIQCAQTDLSVLVARGIINCQCTRLMAYTPFCCQNDSCLLLQFDEFGFGRPNHRYNTAAKSLYFVRSLR